ncbi:hypothetical protein BKI49_04790 [Streptomyces sp. Tue6028]|nr:hypothetical protein BKI49_04790 [Streptomyces sp. Tue6028]
MPDRSRARDRTDARLTPAGHGAGPRDGARGTPAGSRASGPARTGPPARRKPHETPGDSPLTLTYVMKQTPTKEPQP